MANKFAAMVTSPEWQYKLDTEWGLTPIMQYPQIGKEAPYNEDYWMLSLIHI